MGMFQVVFIPSRVFWHDMVKSYNDRLKKIQNKGLCGDSEYIESEISFGNKIEELAKLIEKSPRTIVFTGAGISTSCGIADFRGPNGVWTLEKKKRKRLDMSVANKVDIESDCFEQAKPSFTHNALLRLLEHKKIHHIISQNVDGLHQRSGVPTTQLTELHGNIFLEKCELCHHEYFRAFDVGGMGLKHTGRYCDNNQCHGKLRDCAIDWDTPLPEDKFTTAYNEFRQASVAICMGTSLRIRPAGLMPNRILKRTKARHNQPGQLVIINLQKTHLDRRANVRIFHRCDEVMKKLCELLHISVPSSPSCKEGIDTIIETVNGSDRTVS